MVLKIYGMYASQPTRAVLWFCSINNIPFEFVKVDVSNPGKETKEFTERINPHGRVPAIEDDGFILYESCAILTYLALKHKIEDYYPSKNIQRRAKIDEYLHWHHENTRLITKAYLRPLSLQLDAAGQQQVQQQKKLVSITLRLIEKERLSHHDYLIDNNVSLADLLCFEEVIQLKEISFVYDKNDQKKFENDYKLINKWCERIKSLPQYDKTHEILKKLGSALQKLQSNQDKNNNDNKNNNKSKL